MADDSGDSSAGWLGFLGLGLNAAGQIWANARNERANKQRFLKSVELSNTAHQREVADLRAAGLNPILSAQSGNGASSPDVAAATVDNPAGSAMQVASIYNQRQQALAQTKAADAAKYNAETQAWQIYDARSMGYAGFDVGIGSSSVNDKGDSRGRFGRFGSWLKRTVGYGVNADGKVERVYTIRVNKVTGEAYTVPDNKPINSWRPVEQSKPNSAMSTPAPPVVTVNKTAGGKSTYERDNYVPNPKYNPSRARHEPVYIRR